jgi:hypothetical protein
MIKVFYTIPNERTVKYKALRPTTGKVRRPFQYFGGEDREYLFSRPVCRTGGRIEALKQGLLK